MTDLSAIRELGGVAPLSRSSAENGTSGGGARGGVPLVTHYLRVAARRRGLILGSIAVAVVIGILLTLLATPQYTAVTRLEINREGQRIVNVQDVTPETQSGDQEFYQTQYGLLKSEALAQRVARQLRLQNDRVFFEQHGLAEAFDLNSGSRGQAERLRLATNVLLENVDINPIRLSRLVDIEWTGPNPELAARVSNTWATSFIEFNLERRFEATSYARRFLEQRLEQLRQRLEESERQLVGFASREAIINIPIGVPGADGQTQERSLTAETLVALNTELAQATGDRVRAESRLGQAGRATSETVTNPAVVTLRQRRAEAAAEYARLMTQFEPGYPAAQALAAQIRQLEQSIAREESRVSSSIRTAYNDAVRRERELRTQVEALKRGFLDQRRRSIQYNIFQRDVDTNRELYNGLLQRYKEIGVAGGVGENNVSVVDAAPIPRSPSQPRPLINLALALILGTVVGVGLALIREQIDETITDPTDLERTIGVPLLGVVPKTNIDPAAAMRDPKSSLTEAYLSVQASLSFSTDHGVPRTLTVTSTRPGEGKSTTAFAIAYVLARSGATTLLIDGDMRSPSVHGNLGLANDRGLSTYLSGNDDLRALIQRTSQEPFAILTAGPQPPNAAELLRSGRFDLLLKTLLQTFHHVVIDSPPVMGLADAPIIASRTEGTIYVVEASGVKARIATLALGRLRQGRANLLGTVLTKFEARQSHFGYGYDYGYGYGSERDPKRAD